MFMRLNKNQLEVDDVSWFRIGTEDAFNMKPFNPPTGPGASDYLTGWMVGERKMLMRSFTKQ